MAPPAMPPHASGNKVDYLQLTTCLAYHHHHCDEKRLAGASRRCDRSPERSVLR